MLIAADLPRFLWVEAIRHAVWLKNRSPTRALNGKTPHEAMGLGKPNLANLHEWGMVVWVQISAGKLDAKAAEARFMGYDAERKGYRVYWPEKRTITVERNVRFQPDEIIIPEVIQSEGEQQRLTTTVPNTSDEPRAIEPSHGDADQPESTGIPDGLDAPIPETGRGFRMRRPPGDYARMHFGMAALCENEFEPEFALALGNDDAPRSVDEALAGPESEEWARAMQAEIDQLERLKTWEIVDAPPGVNIINSGFVLTRKRDANGQIASYKARFVGKGYSQVYGVDYYETFAPSVKMASQRVVLSHAAREDWEIHQIDVKGAYLNAHLKDAVYIKPPPGYLKPSDEGKVCRLLKGLYGIKQAGHEWYLELCGTFNKLEFTRSHADHSVFYKHGDEPIIVTVSTDDMTLAAKLLATIEQLKKDLRSHYEISDLGEIHWLLGIEVKRDRTKRTISLSQRAYIETILKEFHLEDATALSVPAEPGTILGTHQCPKTPAEFKDMENVPYARGVGKLMYYYVATGPQIGYVIRVLAQFMSNPGRAHWEALKRVIRYVKGVKDVWLTLGGSEEGLEGFTDSDFASQADRHSISGYTFRFHGGAISWSSKKQSIIALSTTEAEYIAGTHAAKEAIWLRLLIGEITSPLQLPTPIFCDSNGAIALAKDRTLFHPRTKHIDIRYHYIREKVENRDITIIRVGTNDNVADIFTKPLARPKFEAFCSALGLSMLGSHRARGGVLR
jgi:hypothetical protein